MTRLALALILATVTISAFAQILLKAGMSGANVQRALAAGFSMRTVLAIGLDARVLGGLALYFGSAVVWLIVLSKVEVSRAYPFVALGFVLTALFGRLFFHEALSVTRIGAIALICGGVVLLARS